MNRDGVVKGLGEDVGREIENGNRKWEKATRKEEMESERGERGKVYENLEMGAEVVGER